MVIKTQKIMLRHFYVFLTVFYLVWTIYKLQSQTRCERQKNLKSLHHSKSLHLCQFMMHYFLKKEHNRRILKNAPSPRFLRIGRRNVAKIHSVLEHLIFVQYTYSNNILFSLETLIWLALNLNLSYTLDITIELVSCPKVDLFLAKHVATSVLDPYF